MNRSHFSPALAQLRGWVTLLAAAVAISAVMQMVVFAFANYTEARWTESRPDAAQANASVVLPPGVAGAAATRPSAETSGKALGAGDANLRGMSRLSAAVGVVSVFGLAIFTIVGVVVAAGGAVPGVERAVNSAVWAVILALICVPWAQLLRGEAFPGVFSTYESLVEAVENPAAAGGGWSMACRFVLLPIAGLTGALVVAWQFRSGVDRGIVLESMSELEAAIEREMAEVRAKGGGGVGGVRAVGALNRALGDVQAAPVPSMKLAAGAESMSDAPISGSLLRRPGNQGPTASPGPMQPNR